MSEHANEAPYFIGIEPPDNGSEQNDEQRTHSPPYDIMLSAKKMRPTIRPSASLIEYDYYFFVIYSVPVTELYFKSASFE